MSTHNGKIGRLNPALQNLLNERIENGEEGVTILPWLNQHPEVKKLLATRFNGEPISDQNLSNWRTGGYQQWKTQRDRIKAVLTLGYHSHQLHDEMDRFGPSLGRELSGVFVADFAISARDLLASLTDPAQRCAQIKDILRTLKEMRREDYLDERLKLQRQPKGGHD